MSLNNTHGVYGFFRLSDGKCIYIGVDKSIKEKIRYEAHLKPSQKDTQKINTYLQTHKEHEDWVYKELILEDWFDAKKCNEIWKKQNHLAEEILVKAFKPLMNVYHNDEAKRKGGD